jgi:hypothetical protein
MAGAGILYEDTQYSLKVATIWTIDRDVSIDYYETSKYDKGGIPVDSGGNRHHQAIVPCGNSGKVS